MTWTTPHDIKSRWLSQQPIPSDSKLETLIEDLEGQILYHFPGIQERIDAEELSEDYIKSLVSRIIVEFILSGGGAAYQQMSHSYTGAVSESLSFSSKARYSLSLTSDDLTLLAPKNSGKAMGLDLTPRDAFRSRCDSYWRIIPDA